MNEGIEKITIDDNIGSYSPCHKCEGKDVLVPSSENPDMVYCGHCKKWFELP